VSNQEYLMPAVHAAGIARGIAGFQGPFSEAVRFHFFDARRDGARVCGLLFNDEHAFPLMDNSVPRGGLSVLVKRFF
jgi:hypothetical protein